MVVSDDRIWCTVETRPQRTHRGALCLILTLSSDSHLISLSLSPSLPLSQSLSACLSEIGGENKTLFLCPPPPFLSRMLLSPSLSPPAPVLSNSLAIVPLHVCRVQEEWMPTEWRPIPHEATTPPGLAAFLASHLREPGSGNTKQPAAHPSPRDQLHPGRSILPAKIRCQSHRLPPTPARSSPMTYRGRVILLPGREVIRLLPGPVLSSSTPSSPNFSGLMNIVHLWCFWRG